MRIKLSMLWVAMTFLSCQIAWAQHYKVLWSFGADGDGIGPKGKLVSDRAGNLYGTTRYGGAPNCDFNCGTVFELSPTGNGWTETIIYRFCSQANCTDGAIPWAGLISDQSGNLYGTTSVAGPNQYGTVFKLSPPAHPGAPWTLTTLWSFLSGSDGATPLGRLTWDASGNLYGTTGGGGSGMYGCGTVFELRQVSGTWTETVLHDIISDVDGCGPYAGAVFDKAGNLFVTTERGGDTSCGAGIGCGALFELSPNPDGTWSETKVLQFNAATGGLPYGEVNFDPKGNMYSTVSSYGPNCISCGGVFRITDVGGTWVYRAFFFTGPNGAEPYAGVLLDVKDKSLYGTTITGGVGGSCPQDSGCGSVYRIHAGKERVLYNFCSQPNCTDGYEPFSALNPDRAGNLYGTTLYGGDHGAGVVFEIIP